MLLGLWTAAGATDIRAKSRSPGVVPEKERVIVPWAGRDGMRISNPRLGVDLSAGCWLGCRPDATYQIPIRC
jgi:hypothetical protein